MYYGCGRAVGGDGRYEVAYYEKIKAKKWKYLLYLFFSQVALCTHHHPKAWKNARSIKAQRHFDELYEYNLVAFLKELLGVLVSVCLKHNLRLPM